MCAPVLHPDGYGAKSQMGVANHEVFVALKSEVEVFVRKDAGFVRRGPGLLVVKRRRAKTVRLQLGNRKLMEPFCA